MSYTPVSYKDQGDALHFLDAGGVPMIVPKTDTGQIGNLLNALGATGLSTPLDGDVAQVTAITVSDVAIKEVEKAVTSAQLLALNATPIKLVNAPGAGYWLDIQSITVLLDYATAAYTDGDTASFVITYDAAGTQIAKKAVNTLLLLTASGVSVIRPDNPVQGVISGSNNKAVYLSLDHAVAVGDSPLRVRVAYRVRAI